MSKCLPIPSPTEHFSELKSTTGASWEDAGTRRDAWPPFGGWRPASNGASRCAEPARSGGAAARKWGIASLAALTALALSQSGRLVSFLARSWELAKTDARIPALALLLAVYATYFAYELIAASAEETRRDPPF